MNNHVVSFEVAFSLMPLKCFLKLLCFFRKSEPHKLSIWPLALMITFCLGNYVRYDIFSPSNSTSFFMFNAEFYLEIVM